MAVAAVIFIAGAVPLIFMGNKLEGFRYGVPFWTGGSTCIAIAAALIIAIVVALVRRKAASAAQQLPPGSDLRRTA